MMKLTNVLALEMVLGMKEVQENQELVEKLTTMKNQFEKKNKSAVGADGKKILTAEQKKNESLKEVIVAILGEYDEPKAIKELQAENEEIAPTVYSNQKISALIRQLVKDGKVERTEEKRVAKFKLL